MSNNPKKPTPMPQKDQHSDKSPPTPRPTTPRDPSERDQNRDEDKGDR